MHGLSGPALWHVARATLLAQITYASPSWRGFINANEANKLQTILNKAKRWNFLPSDFSALNELFDSADSALFSAVLTVPEHVLHPLLYPRKKTGYNLCKRSHGLMLPEAKCSFLRNNFLVRMLYTDVYWHFSVFTLLFDVPPLRLLMTFNKETDWLIDWLIGSVAVLIPWGDVLHWPTCFQH